MTLWAVESNPVELRSNASEEDLQMVIRAVYKQVLGNGYLLESQRFNRAESLLRNGDISVRQFVNLVAKSDLYRSLFFESSSQYRFIELNFKHLLGRPPLEQTEIAEHVRIYNEQGYDAEIDSYLDSEEYIRNFGENVVPYPRSTQTQVGLKNAAFNRTFSLFRGAASSDRDRHAKLIKDVAANIPTKITAPASGAAIYGSTNKRFRIVVSKNKIGPRTQMSNMEYIVNYNQLSQKVQSIHKTGGKIVSITEIA